jgi:hypothetical protein
MSRVQFGDGDEYSWLYQQHADAAIRGRRGQAFLREMVSALDTMPAKRLAAEVLVGRHGEVCAMGAVAVARGIDTTGIDETDSAAVGEVLGIAERLAMEIAYLNDDRDDSETDEERFCRMRSWAVRQISPEREPTSTGRCSWCCRVYTLRHGVINRHDLGRCPGVGQPPFEEPAAAQTDGEP